MKKIFAFFILIISAAMFITACSSKINYETVSTSTYVNDGELCESYRVYVEDKNVSDDQLKDLLKWVVHDNDNDGKYYYHTVWVYFDKSKASGSDPAEITVEETNKFKDPTITRN